jgi:hypothetical protein
MIVTHYKLETCIKANKLSRLSRLSRKIVGFARSVLLLTSLG